MMLNSTTASVYIITLNWNGYTDTVECLNSLQKITYLNYKIIVVDNGSVNEDYLRLRNYFPNIELVRSESNLGFSGGNNLGIKYALKQNPDYILLLNNDTTVNPDFIEKSIDIFDKYTKVGIVSPIIYYYSNPNKVWSAGGKINRLRGSGVNTTCICDPFVSEFEVNFVSGCCMLIKTEVLNQVGLFDDNYFLYAEDTDLCIRTINAGYKIFVSQAAKIYHKVSQSSASKTSALPVYYTTRNRLYFTKKNFPSFYLLTLLYIAITIAIKSLVWLIFRRIENIFAVLRAYRDFLTNKMGKTSEY